jgi:hypothetical protein
LNLTTVVIVDSVNMKLSFLGRVTVGAEAPISCSETRVEAFQGLSYSGVMGPLILILSKRLDLAWSGINTVVSVEVLRSV